jgi:hypothetical protein
VRPCWWKAAGFSSLCANGNNHFSEIKDMHTPLKFAHIKNFYASYYYFTLQFYFAKDSKECVLKKVYRKKIRK